MTTDLDEAQKTEVTRIRSRVEALIKDHFATGKSTYYLSQLGNDLGEDDRKQLERLTHTKISQFVASTFDYEIGRSGQHQNILYLIASGGTAMSSEATPRYDSRFWAAFREPLQEGERRFIDIETLEFRADAAQATTQTERVREIDAQFLPKKTDIPTADEILKRIEQWLSAQRLDKTPFMLKRRKQHSKHESLLTILVNALDKDQLRRVNLPLDVIQALDTRRI